MMAPVTLIGCTVAVALHAEAWPFELVADTGAVAFGDGLLACRSGDMP